MSTAENPQAVQKPAGTIANDENVPEKTNKSQVVLQMDPAPAAERSMTAPGQLPTPVLLEHISQDLPTVTISNIQQASQRKAKLRRKLELNPPSPESSGNDDQMCLYIICCILLGPLGLLCAVCMANSSAEENKKTKDTLEKVRSKCVNQINILNEKCKDFPEWK